MKIEIPKTVKAIDLGEYAEELRGTEVQVWVNPPQRLLVENNRWVEKAEEAGRLMLAWVNTPSPEIFPWKGKMEEAAEGLLEVFAELWSQGPEPTRWTKDEIRTLAMDSVDSNPNLWIWLRQKTLEAIVEYRAGVKKN